MVVLRFLSRPTSTERATEVCRLGSLTVDTFPLTSILEFPIIVTIVRIIFIKIHFCINSRTVFRNSA